MTKLATEDTEGIKRLLVIEKLFLQDSSKADDCNVLKIILDM